MDESAYYYRLSQCEMRGGTRKKPHSKVLTFGLVVRENIVGLSVDCNVFLHFAITPEWSHVCERSAVSRIPLLYLHVE